MTQRKLQKTSNTENRQSYEVFDIQVRVRVTPVVREEREVRAKFVRVAMINRVVFVKQLSYTVKELKS